LLVHLVPDRLEAPDDHGGRRPVPEPDVRTAPPGGHLVQQYLVHGVLVPGLQGRAGQEGPVDAAKAPGPVLAGRLIDIAPCLGIGHDRSSPPSSARRTAIAMPSGDVPSSVVSGWRSIRMRSAKLSSSKSASTPSRALFMTACSSSGYTKKSPEMTTFRRRPSMTSKSTTTSLPPTVLYSPCIGLHPFCRRRDPGRRITDGACKIRTFVLLYVHHRCTVRSPQTAPVQPVRPLPPLSHRRRTRWLFPFKSGLEQGLDAVERVLFPRQVRLDLVGEGRLAEAEMRNLALPVL